MPLSKLDQRLLIGTPAEREAEAKRQGVFETWETKARRDGLCDVQYGEETCMLVKNHLYEHMNPEGRKWTV